jgi:hypothetical protein
MHYLHEIECVDLVHHIRELIGMNEIEEIVQILNFFVPLFIIFKFYPCKDKWPKRLEVNYTS